MTYSKEPIAITGMGCRYPGATDPTSFWRLIAEGQDALSEPSLSRSGRGLSGFPDVSGAGVGGLLDNLERFDADFFGISPREASCLEPQQRLLLEVAWNALEDAGLTGEQVAGTRAGVFVGLWTGDFENNLYALGAPLDLHLLTGVGQFSGPNRISYAFDLRGPSLAVNTGCSSSLVAVHLACKSIWAGDSEFALAGGVNAILRPEITNAFMKADVLAPDRRCKFADISANGYVRSEGAGIVVLKPLSKAVRGGDPIYAIIRGGAVNSDGQSDQMFVHPNGKGQESLLREACRDAGVNPLEVQYVEAHGTGTAAGDPVELGALGSVYGSSERDSACLIGSVKTNIGHTEAAAGIAGLMKVALSLWHGTIPASLHFRKPNPKIPWDKIALKIQAHATPWPSPEPHIAGVTAFGLTGTNAHMLLEKCPVKLARPRSPEPATGRLHLVPLSAMSPEALDELARSYGWQSQAAYATVSDIADIAYTTALRRTHHDQRLALVVREPEEFKEKLGGFLRKESSPGTTWGRRNLAEGSKIAFIFPGQGAQWTGMGRQLFREAPAFRDEILCCDAEMRRLVDWSLLDLFTTPQPLPARIDTIQPALFAMYVALAKQWRDWGIEPDAVVGHSMGEVAAAYVAGALSLADAAAVICRRSALLCRVSGQGSMAMVELPMEILKARISDCGDRLSIAASNGSSSTVLSGETFALQKLLAELEAEQIFCRLIKVDVASHSAFVDPICGDLLEKLKSISPRRGSIPIYSTLTGKIESGEALDNRYWVRNLREPVMFGGAVQELIRDGFGTFIEVSPHPLLTIAVQTALDAAGRGGSALPSLKRDEDERASLLATAGSLYVSGHPLNWSHVNGPGRCITLPSYPFQREHMWPDFSLLARGSQRTESKHAFLARRLELASHHGACIWEMEIGVASTPYLADHRVRGHAVFPGAGYLELVLAAAKEMEAEPCSIQDVEFVNALVLPDASMRQVQLSFSPRSADSREFSISGREADGSWQILASGKLSFEVSLPPVPETVEAILARCPAALTSEDHYRRMAERGLQYGPAFQLVDQVSHSAGETLVRVDTSKVGVGDSMRHLLHPAILDAALQAVGEFFPDSQLAPDETYVPVGIERVRIFHIPKAGSELFAHATKLKSEEGLRSDVVLFDGDGLPVAEIRNLLCRPLRRMQAGERSLYDLAWTADADSEKTPKVASGRWIVFADDGGVAARIAETLKAMGNECVLIRRAEANSAAGSEYRIDPENFPDYQRLMVQGSSVDGILHVWTLDLPSDADASWETLDSHQRVGTKSIALLVRALAECGGWGRPPRLWIATAGLHDLTGSDRVSFEHGPTWGFGRGVACEHPELRCALLDLSLAPDDDEIALVARTLLSNTTEDQIAVRGKTRYLARFRDLPAPERAPLRVTAGTATCQATIGEPGNLGSVELELAPDPEPGPGEVAIKIAAAGLNFIDVLKSLGIYPGIEPGTIPPLGGECAGTVARVGAGVHNLRVGDEVVAVTPSVSKTGLMASHAVVPAELVLPKPANLTWEEAATIPLAYITAWYGLHSLAGMRQGERVLIQSGAGGVGLAAIQLAQRAGATVFATAGGAEKRRFLKDLGVQHVFDSRSTAFAAEILKATNGAGVDIVLNSLSGEFIEAGISVLGRYGRFVEIGKRDIYDDHQLGLSPFRRNLAFFAVDLAAMFEERRDQVATLLGQILTAFQDGSLRPPPIKTYPASQASQMFQSMAGARHVGKLALKFDEEEVTVRPPRPGKPHFRKQGGYLITGGQGGIGLLVARWMVENGAGYVVLAARRNPSEETTEAIREMNAMGAVVRTVAADVSKPEQVGQILDHFGGSFPPLRGVVHAAAVIDDELIAKMGPLNLTKVMMPKAYGAWNLHRATIGLDLDFFAMFSSIASVLPQPGHGSYAAANAFLDSLARYRRALAKPGLTVNWGFWSGTGLAITQGAMTSMRGYAARGIKPFSTKQGLDALGYLLGCTTPVALSVPIDWRKLASSYASEGTPPVLSSLIEQHAQPGSQQADATDPLALLRSATPEQARYLIESHLTMELSKVLGLAPSRIQKDKRLGAMGLDSLMAVTFVRRLSNSFGILLPATAAFNYPTISALALHVASKLGVEIETANEPRPARAADPQPLPLGVEELSDEQAINALLSNGENR